MKLPVLKKQTVKNQLTAWRDPVDEVFSLIRRSLEPERLVSPWLWERWLIDERESGYWWPRADVVETDKAVKIRVDLPGIKPEDVNLEVDEQSLVISGRAERVEEEREGEWYCLERKHGEFRREFELPNGCEIDKIEAVSKHGTLYITIPKKPEAQKKKVEIKEEV